MSTKPIPQEEWIKRSNLRFFQRADSSVLVPQVVSLSHEVVIRILSAQFEAVSRDVHYISVAARQLLSDRVSAKIYQEEEIMKAEQEVFRAFEQTNKHFDTRIEQAEQLLQASGMGNIGMRGGAMRLFEANCTTRTATKWLELLKKVDHYLTLNYQMWVTGEIGPANWTDGEALAAKLNNERDARVVLTQLSRKLNAQFTQIRMLVSRVIDQRIAEEAERRRKQSERDRVRTQKGKAAAAPAADKPAEASLKDAEIEEEAAA